MNKIMLLPYLKLRFIQWLYNKLRTRSKVYHNFQGCAFLSNLARPFHTLFSPLTSLNLFSTSRTHQALYYCLKDYASGMFSQISSPLLLHCRPFIQLCNYTQLIFKVQMFVPFQTFFLTSSPSSPGSMFPYHLCHVQFKICPLRKNKTSTETSIVSTLVTVLSPVQGCIHPGCLQ